MLILRLLHWHTRSTLEEKAQRTQLLRSAVLAQNDMPGVDVAATRAHIGVSIFETPGSRSKVRLHTDVVSSAVPVDKAVR
jgi:hypothetical protein